MYIPSRHTIPKDKLFHYYALWLEDFADEWVTKLMYGFRWNRTIDQNYSSKWLAAGHFLGKGDVNKINQFKMYFFFFFLKILLYS